MNSFTTQALFNLPIFSGTKAELYVLLQDQLQKDNLVTIATPNPEQVIQSRQDSQFLKNLQNFEVLLPDGQGVVWASQWLKKPLEGRIPGVEVVEWLLGLPEDQTGKILIIGGRGYEERSEGRSQRAEVRDQNVGIKLKPQISDLRSPVQEIFIQKKKAYWIEGYQDIKHPSETEEEHVQAVIKKIMPSIILVAFGAPWQEQWVISHREFLEKNKVKIAMVVGGAIDMLTDRVKRAPKFVQKMQLEWLFRLIQQPWRWRRQMRLIQFTIVVLRKVVTQKK